MDDFRENLGQKIDWAERSEFWRTYEPKKKGPRRKFSFREPLIVCGHGARIRVEHNSLFIRNGFTHYPQEQEKIRLFPGEGNLPDRIILLDTSGGITFDALSWMFEQNISLIQIDWRGRVNCVGNNSGSPFKRTLVDRQIRFKRSRRAVELSEKLIGEKIRNSILTIEAVFPASEKSNLAIVEIGKYLDRLNRHSKKTPQSKLLGIEGAAAAAYFRSWQGIPLNWSGLKRKPIPDNWLEIGSRTMTWRRHGKNARHPVNAMLNYSYAIMLSELRGRIVAEGLDPSIGFAHGNSKNNIPLAYDLMEPLRPVADKLVLEFALRNTFTPDDCAINRVGACRLNPQLARAVAKTIRSNDGAVGDIVRRYANYLS